MKRLIYISFNPFNQNFFNLPPYQIEPNFVLVCFVLVAAYLFVLIHSALNSSCYSLWLLFISEWEQDVSTTCSWTSIPIWSFSLAESWIAIEVLLLLYVIHFNVIFVFNIKRRICQTSSQINMSKLCQFFTFLNFYNSQVLYAITLNRASHVSELLEMSLRGTVVLTA